MKKILIIPLLLVVFSLSAAPIGEKRAREIAAEFFQMQTSRASTPALSLVWAGDDITSLSTTRSSANTDQGLLYIYNRANKKGFVVVAGDSNVERAIVAFSHNHSFDVENMPTGARYMLSGWCRQVAAARTGALPPSRTSRGSEVGAVEVQYKTAEWNQGAPFNDEAPVYDGYRSVTGCVATAMSIICHYNRWPEKGVGTTPAYSYEDPYGVNRSIPANELGRTYNYSVMRSDNYANGYTAEEGAAVAAIMKDMGTSVRMVYHYEGSGAMSLDVPIALATYFGYSKNSHMLNRDKYSYDDWERMLKSNIAQYGPTYLSGNDGSGGHAFVTDGYTTDGYFSINYGWGGVNNGFYLLPNIVYIYGFSAIFGLTPDKSGVVGSGSYLEVIPLSNSYTNFNGFYSATCDYRAGSEVSLGIAGLRNVGTEDFSGDIRIVWCDEDGVVKSVLHVLSGESIPTNISFWYNLDLPIISIPYTPEIEYGDRLRIQYKDKKDAEWRWARSPWSDATVEHIMKAKPDDISSRLIIQYQKGSKVLYFQPALAVQYVLLDASDKEIRTGWALNNSITVIPLSECKSGEYRVLFKCGGDPYVLTLVL